ncbi:MAG TPA: hypothetical protein VF283_16750 [Bryobacteraceae bacterium]
MNQFSILTADHRNRAQGHREGRTRQKSNGRLADAQEDPQRLGMHMGQQDHDRAHDFVQHLAGGALHNGMMESEVRQLGD